MINVVKIDHKQNKKNSKKQEKTMVINDNLFKIGMRKGLIQKNEDGYHFIGDYEELLAFKTKGTAKYFKWLD